MADARSRSDQSRAKSAPVDNERSVFTTTADLHLIDAAYARATQRVSSGLQKAAPLVVDGIDEEQCKHRVKTLRRTLRLVGRVDLCTSNMEAY